MIDLVYQYTQNNHYRWGWNGDWFNRPTTEDARYRISLTGCSRPPLGFREECIKTAELIANSTSKKIVVGLSGGSDSQMVCLSLREAKVPFEVIILRLADFSGSVINEHDIQNAYAFCAKFDVKYHDLPVSLEEFYAGKGRAYAAKYGMVNPRTLIQAGTMDHVHDMGAYYIMAGGDVTMAARAHDRTPDLKIGMISERLTEPSWWQAPLPVLQHMMEAKYEGTSKFYLYTPELILSFIDDPLFQKFYAAQTAAYGTFCAMSDAKNYWRLFSSIIKPMMTASHWPEMIVDKKYTGFEMTYDKHGRGTNRMDDYTKMLEEAAQPHLRNQAVVIPISNLIETLKTPGTKIWTSVDLVIPDEAERQRQKELRRKMQRKFLRETGRTDGL